MTNSSVAIIADKMNIYLRRSVYLVLLLAGVAGRPALSQTPVDDLDTIDGVLSESERSGAKTVARPRPRVSS